MHLRHLHNRGDLTLVPSHQLGIDLMRRGYRNIRVVARGVDTACSTRRDAARRCAPPGTSAPGDLVAAHVGRLAPEKNLDLVMASFDAMSAMCRRAPAAGRRRPGAPRAWMREHPGHIYAGMRHGEDLAAHYASADLFLFPSLTETYGNVTLEAMASGLPVVAFRMAAAAELIRHGHNGMLADPAPMPPSCAPCSTWSTRPGRAAGSPPCRRAKASPRSTGNASTTAGGMLREADRSDLALGRQRAGLPFPPGLATVKVRSIFISDVHLGTRGCQADRLLDFLRDYESEHLFLIGDIIDFWAMNRGIHWTPAQNTVVQKILRRARHGQKVMLIPGNHDEAMREYDGVSFGDILVGASTSMSPPTARFLLLHGDEFDQVTRYHRWLASSAMSATTCWCASMPPVAPAPRCCAGRATGRSPAIAKNRVKRAVSFIFDFEDSVIHAVRERGLDGVICGHIHSAALRRVDGVTYVNCGDWVDSCTAIVEHHDGELELIRAWQPVAVPQPADGIRARSPSRQRRLCFLRESSVFGRSTNGCNNYSGLRRARLPGFIPAGSRP
jgi:UDP-2,3-diacylglucosamine pyrophosphatase LpxH